MTQIDTWEWGRGFQNGLKYYLNGSLNIRITNLLYTDTNGVLQLATCRDLKLIIRFQFYFMKTEEKSNYINS